MLPRGISHRALNGLVQELREGGLWAERHSYSIRIMYEGKFVASLHLYPGFNEAQLRLYGDSLEVNELVRERVLKAVERHLGGLRVEAKLIRRGPF